MRTNSRLPFCMLPIVFLLTATTHPGIANAREPFAPSDTETLVLPPYCAGIMYPDKFPNSRDTWAKTLAPKDGKPLPLHHYCYGLNFLNRAKKKTRNPEERGGDLTDASNLVGDVMNARDDYILKPDFYLAKGEILLLQGKKVDAEFNFRRATEIRPAYPKGWLALSDLLVQTGRRDQAREALEKGLNAAPDKYKDYMKKRLAELDAGAGQSAGGEPTTAGSVGSSPTR